MEARMEQLKNTTSQPSAMPPRELSRTSIVPVNIIKNKVTQLSMKPPSDYRDFSQVDVETINDASSWINKEIVPKEEPFPVKLHMMLSELENQEIICWMAHGRAWKILQTKKFEEKILPRYFRHGRYASFYRQVNGWGFSRIKRGMDYGAYYHELFLRGMPHLSRRMRRRNFKEPENLSPPNFYELSIENPLPETSSRKSVCPTSKASASTNIQAVSNPASFPHSNEAGSKSFNFEYNAKKSRNGIDGSLLNHLEAIINISSIAANNRLASNICANITIPNASSTQLQAELIPLPMLPPCTAKVGSLNGLINNLLSLNNRCTDATSLWQQNSHINTTPILGSGCIAKHPVATAETTHQRVISDLLNLQNKTQNAILSQQTLNNHQSFRNTISNPENGQMQLFRF